MPTPPEDPDYFDKVNYVIDAWSSPCEAPWYIYVETLKPALLKAFLTLMAFGWDDVARGYTRPRGLGRRTGKKPRKGKARSFPRFPEWGETIGSNFPGADELKGEQWSRAGKTLWRIDNAIQAVSFGWLVADVTIDLAFNWTSLLYETVWCQTQSLGRFSYTKTGYDGNSGGFWWNVAFDEEDYEVPPPTWLLITGLAGPTGCRAIAAVSFKKVAGFDPPTETAVRLVEHGTGFVFAQNGPHPADPDGSSTMPLSGDMPPSARWRVQSWHDAIYADVGAGVTYAKQLPG